MLSTKNLKKISGDRIGGCILLVISIDLFLRSIHYKFFVGTTPGSGLFPGIVAGTLILLALLWLITGSGKSKITPADSKSSGHEASAGFLTEDELAIDSFGIGEDELAIDPEELNEDWLEIEPAGKKRILFIVAWSMVHMLTFEKVGFIPSMTLYIAGILIVVARMRWWSAVLGTLAFSILIQIGAHRLGVVLPDPLGLLKLLGQ